LVIKEEIRLRAEATDRSRRSALIGDSFPGFRNEDVMVAADGKLETGRTDLEELKRFLSDGSVREERDEFGSSTDRGAQMRAARENMDDLHTNKGTTAKMSAVKRATYHRPPKEGD
jgi:hypothetical protein